MKLLRVTSIVCSFVLALSFAAQAQLSESVVDERLAFLEERLEADRAHGTLWQWGWLAPPLGGLIYGVVEAEDENDAEDRVDDIVSAVQGAIGIAYLQLAPMEARLGARPIRGMPAATLAEKQNKLLVAEGLLERNYLRAQQRTRWMAHLGSVACNLAAGVFIVGFGNLGDAAIVAGSGIVAGSLQLWTQPRRATTDWPEYQALLTKTASPANGDWRGALRVKPSLGGIAIRYQF